MYFLCDTLKGNMNTKYRAKNLVKVPLTSKEKQKDSLKQFYLEMNSS